MRPSNIWELNSIVSEILNLVLCAFGIVSPAGEAELSSVCEPDKEKSY